MRFIALFVAAGGPAFCAGCTGSAVMQFVSLNATRIDPPPVKVWRYQAQEAYWWVDQAGEINIVMRSRKSKAFLGRFGKTELSMSLVPGPPPAGSGKDYTLRRRETRTVLVSGIGRQRYTSYAGVMDLLIDDETRVHGSFRIWMRPQSPVLSLSPLPQQPGSVLVFGTFKAVKSEKRGAAIRAFCESQGGQRKTLRPPTTTKPAKSSSHDGRSTRNHGVARTSIGH